jgi:predicted enzyme related to lactoylglutathione lyase
LLLSIEVPDVDAALARVGCLGGEAPAPANDMPWGQRVAHVKDPDGNAVNLTTTSA